MERKHHHSTFEERLQAFVYLDQGKTIKETARLCRVSPSTIKAWNRLLRTRGKSYLKPKKRIYSRYPEGIKRVDEELEFLRMENAILEKANALRKERGQSKKKVMIVSSLRKYYPLKALLRYVELPRSTYYYRISHHGSDKYVSERKLIRCIFEQSRGAYGYRRITFALKRDHSVLLDRKTVANIMREEKLKAKGHRKRRYNSYKGDIGKVVPNIIARTFSSQKPLRKLVSDITQFQIKSTKIYLSPLIDLFNGEVIS